MTLLALVPPDRETSIQKMERLAMMIADRALAAELPLQLDALKTLTAWHVSRGKIKPDDEADDKDTGPSMSDMRRAVETAGEPA